MVLKSPISVLIDRLIPGIRYPWLFAILAGLLAIDLVVPDPVPLLDEVVLGLLTFLAASWRIRKDDADPPPKDVTPKDEAGGVLPAAGTGQATETISHRVELATRRSAYATRTTSGLVISKPLAAAASLTSRVSSNQPA